MGAKGIGVAVAVAALGLPLVACGGTGNAASADNYPTRNIELIVNSSPGGILDAGARAIAPCLSDQLGRTVVVKNVEGASGTAGNKEILNAKPDGYTMGLGTGASIALNPVLEPNVGYTVDDFTFINSVHRTQMMFIGGESAPYADAQALIDAGKNNPGTINVGTPGPTSPKTLILNRMDAEAAVKLNAVPFTGQSGVITAVLGDNVPVGSVEADNSVKELVASGKAKPLLALSANEVPWSPDTPTLPEAGLEQIKIPDNEYPIYGPKELPENVVAKWTEAAQACVGSQEVIDKIGTDYMSPWIGPEATTEHFREVSEQYRTLAGV